jgi:hypothetical protein
MQVLEYCPANSSDLNPIEMLWAVMAGKPVTANVGTQDEMFAEVERVWSEHDQGIIDGLVLSIKRWCELCRICGGKTISRLLSRASGTRVRRTSAQRRVSPHS